MAKRTGSQGHDVQTLTPEREALEHPHILFRLSRDPLLVAMSARELDKPEPRKPAAAKGDGGKRGRGK
jgi:hypothetical protein